MATEICFSPPKMKPSVREDGQLKETEEEMLSIQNTVEEKIRNLGLSENKETLSNEGCIKTSLTEDQNPEASEESAVSSSLPQQHAKVELIIAEDIEDSNEFYEDIGDVCCLEAAGSATATDYESCEENYSEEDEGVDVKADVLGDFEDDDDAVVGTEGDIKVFSQEDEDNAFCMQDSKAQDGSVECAYTKVGDCKKVDEYASSTTEERSEPDSGSDTADDDVVCFKAQKVQDNDKSFKKSSGEGNEGKQPIEIEDLSTVDAKGSSVD